MKNSIKRVQSESSFSALSSVRILREAKKIFQYILMAVAVVATASCSNELDEALQPAHNGTLQFVVSDFPAFGEDPETRAIGTQDAGKTAWEAGDELIVELYSSKYKSQWATLIYDGSKWNLNGSLSYLENETPAVRAYYAPCYEVTGNTMNLRTGMLFGMTEYLEASDCQVENNTISISFEDVIRDYSRLRIVGLAGETYTVTTTDFTTPAGIIPEATEPYTLTADEKGNAYLYGTFAKDATVTVKQGTATLAGFTFSEDKGFANGTEQGKSYALDARPVVDGASTEIDVMVNAIKSYLEKGITTIVVTGSEPAIIDMGSYTNTAIGEAIYRLSQDASYYGKIDLILPDVTEIIDQEFYAAFALNSLTLPQVTKIGNLAFQGCYYLKQLTFGSVLTEIVETGGSMFYLVGKEVGNCDLVLNCGQMNSQYVPNLATNTWTIFYTYEFKSITLTHTGENSECDECKAKANQ